MGKFEKGNKYAVLKRKEVLKIFSRSQSGRLNLYIRLNKRDTLKPFAKAVYEATTGDRLTLAYVITFKDNNPANCKFSNLIKIQRNELMRAGVDYDDSELKEKNLAKIIEQHKKEIELVHKYFAK